METTPNTGLSSEQEQSAALRTTDDSDLQIPQSVTQNDTIHGVDETTDEQGKFGKAVLAPSLIPKTFQIYYDLESGKWTCSPPLPNGARRQWNELLRAALIDSGLPRRGHLICECQYTQYPRHRLFMGSFIENAVTPLTDAIRSLSSSLDRPVAADLSSVRVTLSFTNVRVSGIVESAPEFSDAASDAIPSTCLSPEKDSVYGDRLIHDSADIAELRDRIQEQSHMIAVLQDKNVLLEQELRDLKDTILRILKGRKTLEFEVELTSEQEIVFQQLDAIRGNDPNSQKQAEKVLLALSGVRVNKSLVDRLKTYLKSRSWGIRLADGRITIPGWLTDIGRPEGGYMRLSFTNPKTGKTDTAETLAEVPRIVLAARPDGRRSSSKT